MAGRHSHRHSHRLSASRNVFVGGKLKGQHTHEHATPPGWKQFTDGEQYDHEIGFDPHMHFHTLREKYSDEG